MSFFLNYLDSESEKRYINNSSNKCLKKTYSLLTNDKSNELLINCTVTKQLNKKRVQYRFACGQCDAKFTYACYLKVHKRTHTGERPFSCQICGKKFKRLQQCKVHSRIEHEQIKISCPDCGKHFGTEANLYRHRIATHMNVKRWICGFCSSPFAQSQDLRKHLLSCHQFTLDVISNKTKKSYKEEDGKITVVTYKKESSVKNEVCFNVNANEIPLIVTYKCSICDKGFTTFAKLNRHSKVHGDRKYVCELCNKGFIEKCNLKIHMLVHTKEKPIVCPQCDKQFRYRRDLKDHLCSHDGVLFYDCDECDTQFLRQRDLRRHFKERHLGIKYSCEICGLSFLRKNYLERFHMAIHRSPTVKEKKYHCKLCLKKFSTKKEKSKHECINGLHKRRKKYTTETD